MSKRHKRRELRVAADNTKPPIPVEAMREPSGYIACLDNRTGEMQRMAYWVPVGVSHEFITRPIPEGNP